MIRAMEPEDLEQVVCLLAVLHIETPYRQLAVDWSLVLNVFVAAMAKGSMLALVAEHQGKITGLLLAKTEALWFVQQHGGPRIASDMVFYSQRAGDGRRMLRQMVAWAFALPRVVRIELAVSSGQARMDVMAKLYEKEGFVQEGSFFVRNHPMYQEALDGVPSMAEEEEPCLAS